MFAQWVCHKMTLPKSRSYELCIGVSIIGGAIRHQMSKPVHAIIILVSLAVWLV